MVLYNDIYNRNKKLDDIFMNKYFNIESKYYEKNCLELIVELCELANESKCFKYWTVKKPDKELVLEEFSDSLMMILYMFNKYNIDKIEFIDIDMSDDILESFNYLIRMCTLLMDKDKIDEKFLKEIFTRLIHIGRLLDLSDIEIVDACNKKILKQEERLNNSYLGDEKMEKEKYYISTAIAYASSKPHIGNTYEIVLADVIARYKRLCGYDVYFQTGTDEHGQKIEEKALAEGVNPQKYVDDKAEVIKQIWDVMNTSYDNFVRTTDLKHKEVVQKIFKKLYDQGDIYLSEYKGLYCTPCESFWTESQLVDGKCPDCGREVKEASEEAYFFKMSKYSKWLEEYIESHPRFIEPESRKNEIMNNFIKPGLQDLCVSRTSFKWGVPVSFDDKHVVYVWIDALSNYITFLGYDPELEVGEDFKKYWPANLHLIGKDILRFHTIYWPIMLHCLGVEMPEHIFGHPWLLFGSDKMSKSRGNIVYADDLVSQYGVDAVRFYMIHEMPYASDGTYTEDLLIDAVNTNLANVIGNLVNRTIGMANKYFDGVIENKNVYEDIDKELIDLVLSTKGKVEDNMDKFRIADSLENVLDIYRRCNKYIDETMPWVLAKDETKKDRLATVLYNIVESIRIATVYLSCYLPDTASSIFNQINTEFTDYDSVNAFGKYISGTRVNDAVVLFKRIDKE